MINMEDRITGEAHFGYRTWTIKIHSRDRKKEEFFRNIFCCNDSKTDFIIDLYKALPKRIKPYRILDFMTPGFHEPPEDKYDIILHRIERGKYSFDEISNKLKNIYGKNFTMVFCEVFTGEDDNIVILATNKKKKTVDFNLICKEIFLKNLYKDILEDDM